MTLRWFLVWAVATITIAVAVWDRAAYVWATPKETISGRVNVACHHHPELAFGMGAGLMFCSLLPLLPRRRRWLAVFFAFMLLMAVLAAHCVWPVFGLEFGTDVQWGDR